QFPENNPDDHIYVDGGALLNYPIMTFDEYGVNDETLGFTLVQGDRFGVESDLGFGTFRLWAESLYETIKKVQLNLLNMQAEHRNRTVMIDVGQISPIDFEIDEEQKEWLIDRGRTATEDFLKLYDYRQSFRYRVARTVRRVVRGFRED
ncbi:MAG: hypothetical protein KDK27_21425, partial [Leptospiraceae bacterium]|nr:hypothetical protein [Leptospiraceae bacterium]